MALLQGLDRAHAHPGELALSALGPDDLLITAGTLGSPPFPELAEAAAGAGFAGLSIWPHSTWVPAREAGWSGAELRRLVEDHGLVVNDVDALMLRADVDPPRPARESAPEEVLLEAGEALGARYLNVVLAARDPVPVERGAEILSGICARARERGLRVHIEFVPFSTVNDVSTAWEIIEASGTDAGLMIDTWHTFRGPTDIAEIAAIPGDRILGLQVNDLLAEPRGDLMDETMNHRLPPGEGDFDYPAFNAALAAAGGQTPWTVEVFSEALRRQHSPAELAKRLFAATRAAQAA